MKKILAVLLIVSLLVSPVMGAQWEYDGSDEQINYCKAQYKEFQRIKDSPDKWVRITVGTTQVNITEDRILVHVGKWLIISSGAYLVDIETGVMYDNGYKYDPEDNYVITMTSDELEKHRINCEEMVLAIAAAYDAKGWEGKITKQVLHEK